MNKKKQHTLGCSQTFITWPPGIEEDEFDMIYVDEKGNEYGRQTFKRFKDNDGTHKGKKQ